MFSQILKYLPIVLGLSIVTVAHADTNSSADVQQIRSNNAKISDQELAKAIKDKIGTGWFSKGYEQVQVKVNNGAVILTGSVKTFDEKNKVEKEIRNIEGVASLDSQLNVQESISKENQQRQFSQDTYGSNADDQLNKKIRDLTSRGWLWNSYKDVSLNTNNGVVTLEGVVSSISDQQKLMNEIQKVDGVKSVSSNLKISK